MNKLKLITLLITLSLFSCKKDILSSEFNCGSSSVSNTKETRDILKKFKLNIPVTWKKQLYYDEYKSQIYTADTTKQFTETYILDASWHQGELIFDESFNEKIKANLENEKLKVVKSGKSIFKEKETYYNLSKGMYRDYPYNLLQIFVKSGADEYLLFVTKVYGKEKIDERICESVSILNDLTILE